MKYWCTCVLLVFWGAEAWSRHIVGGDISISKRGTAASDFTLTLTLIYDDVLGTTDDKAFVSIFRKSNHTRVEDFTLTRILKQQLPYTNARCVGNAPLSRITLVKYSADIGLATNTYNDPDGYYLAWEECCRNGNVLNLQNPSRVGLAFYAEIPPVSVRNSSPIFKTPDVKYVCVGKNFEADFGAADSDKDSLSYALVTPLVGSTDGGGTFPSKAQQGPYARADWVSGFDSTKTILGKIPLQVNSKTGKITLNASQIGTFAFAVRCTEFRNGIKIGEVRREFIFTVVDCLAGIPTPPVNVFLRQATQGVTFELQANGHVSSLRMCQGDSALLKADDEDPQWGYQWQLNGKNVGTENQISFTANQSGIYTVVKRSTQSCSSEDSTYNSTLVSFKSTPIAKITSSRTLPLCDSDSTNLSVQVSNGTTVRWQRDGQNVGNIGSTLFYVKQAGNYKALVTDESSKCVAKDSIAIRVILGPPAPISITGTPIFCANDSVKLITPKVGTYEYVWYSGNVPIVPVIINEFYPQKSGKYSVAVVDTITRCATRSVVYDIIVKPSPTVTLDSIPPLCTSGLQAVTLKGTPTGGVYSGKGVTGNRFITQNLTAGSYPITYTFTNTEGCAAKDTKWVQLAPPPRLEVPKNLVVLRGDSVEIRTLIPQNATVSWFPSIGLSNPLSARPSASPDRTTTYKITVKTSQGCVVEGEVTVTVIVLTIPNGFTPNNDGTNDTWEIAGIKDYPNCVVEVFNRWGNLVFSKKGYDTLWDGTWNGEAVPVGTYYYHIYLREFEYKLAGSLNVIR